MRPTFLQMQTYPVTVPIFLMIRNELEAELRLAVCAPVS